MRLSITKIYCPGIIFPFLFFISLFFSAQNCFADHQQSPNFSVLNEEKYARIFLDTREKLDQLMKKLKSSRKQNNDKEQLDDQVGIISKEFSDVPYLSSGAMGEGDWQPSSLIYRPNAPHIKQYPVYRVDGFDCQTLVQVVMALLHADNLDKFDQHFIKIAYGAAGSLNGEIIHYYNRNNFIDGDFNPINQKNGVLQDVTSKGPLAKENFLTKATITRQNWFAMQQNDLKKTVYVLHEKDGDAMVKRFKTTYRKLDFPRFKSEEVFLSYIPKKKLVIKSQDGSYQPNKSLLDKIPTPALIEIVRDAKKWELEGVPVKALIGSELNVSHSGILYRETFKKGDLIYQKIRCGSFFGKKQCKVIPVFCEMENCRELMLLHATKSHPDGYYWYKDQKGNQVCSRNKPNPFTTYSTCNRVESLPFFAYLTNFQYGKYWYMEAPSLLGVHIEKLR
jgi:hypothetical protein